MKIAIIGTRTPTDDQILKASFLAVRLSAKGHIIATGGADGIDLAAMRSTAPGQLEVYLPWESYNKALIPRHARCIVYSESRHTQWAASVNMYHPAPEHLTSAVRKLHARNCGIVLGSTIVVAFPRSGEGGGSGQGIRIARGLGIPVLVQPAKISLVNRADDLLQLVEDILLAKLQKSVLP